MLVLRTHRTSPCLHHWPVTEERNVSRTPETLTATKRAAQLANASTGGNHPAPASRKPSVSEIRAAASFKAAMNEEKPANAAAGMKVGDEFDGSQMQLLVSSMLPYDKNPRTGPNPRYQQIKESIRAQGVTSQLTVTRRPGSELYMPYAGGNTRLLIVQELLKETGEERWKRLTVTYRAWPGDAAVIAAHLVENEQRGDTSYWEKAQGVASLKQELEKESKRILTVADVNAEARRLGMDFGLKTVQDFLFAVEWLGPVGPKTQAEMVRNVLKPTITGLLGVCNRLGQKSATTRAAIDQSLTLAGEAAAQTGEADKALDVEDLVRSLQRAVAESLGVDAGQLGNMLASLAASPNLTAQQLRATATAPKSPPPLASPPVADDVPPDEAPPLGSSASRAAPSPAPRAPSPPTAPAPQQLPLRPAMLAPVPPALAPTTQSTDLDPNDPEQLGRLILAAVMRIADITQQGETLCGLAKMPLGYFMDLPEDLHVSDGMPVADVQMRKSTWHVLASLSGQFDADVAQRIPPNESRWGALLSRGQLGNQYRVCATGQVFDGRAYLDIDDLLRVVHHPQLGPMFVELLALAARKRHLAPDLFPVNWRPVSL